MASEAKPGKGVPADGVRSTIVPSAVTPKQAGGPPAHSLPADVNNTGVADQTFGNGLPANVNK